MPQKRTSPSAAIVTALTLLCSGSAIASDNKITNIKVDGDTVRFSTSQAKVHTLPNCVASGNTQQWTLSLTSAAGKASYTLLVAAMTDNRSISVTSANDCADSTGYERAQSIEVGDTIANTTNGSSGHFSLYKWDGVTKIGTIFGKDHKNRSGIRNIFDVLRVNPGNVIHRVSIYGGSVPLRLLYSNESCTDLVGSLDKSGHNSHLNFNEFYNNGQFFTTSDTASVKHVNYLAENGACVPLNEGIGYQQNVYSVLPSDNVHPLCGKGMCQIKAE